MVQMTSVVAVLLMASQLSIANSQMDITPCGRLKGCLFAPPGCNPSADCGIQFSYQVNEAFLNMELAGTPPSQIGYIAVGFSQDDKMVDVFFFHSSKYERMNEVE
ncbi:hypothetical protein DICVIV_05047 [Dictyocaulus viviparus]|uniref:DOMON domain-containing protein n=1 Tax=Dictyocaulus viviparus TaxID=29172 RepID=A0A0D8XYE4_DICVI|nr:hypothetical protein DICVIV_05047 [Dictyocaulus viviparus]